MLLIVGSLYHILVHCVMSCDKPSLSLVNIFKLCIMYCSPNIVQVIKSRRMRWAGHVARMGRKGVYRGLVGKLEGKIQLGRTKIYFRILLIWIYRKWDAGVWTGSSWFRIGTGGGYVWMRWWTFEFHKMRRISLLATEPVSFSRRTLLHGVSKCTSGRTASLRLVLRVLQAQQRCLTWRLTSETVC